MFNKRAVGVYRGIKPLGWNGRMVGKQKSSNQALRIHNWQVLRAMLGRCYSQHYRILAEFKLVKEQSLIFCNSKFTACVILKEH